MSQIKTPKDTEGFKISTRLLMQEALKKGYKLSYFQSSPGTMSGVTRAVKEGKELFFKSTCTSLTSAIGVFAAENKALTHSLLSGSNVNTPETVVISTESEQELKRVLGRMQQLVVKPVAMNHGDGITVGVKSYRSLLKAIRYARAESRDDDVLLQKQVEGREYRFLVVGGKVIAVAYRRPPAVIGDGVSTVAELVARLNKDPRRGEGHLAELTKIDINDVVYHKGAKFLQKVLPVDKSVNILETSNLSRGGESVDVTEIASPELKKLAVRAAKACFAGIAGVDIITNDIAGSDISSSYVIEVNLTPGLRMHQFPTVGKPIDVARKIFNSIERTAQPISKPLMGVGRSEFVRLIELHSSPIPARIDTGATKSSLWASDIKETATGLSFVLFDKQHELYTGKKIYVTQYSRRVVSSSMGQTEIRFVIKTKLMLKGRKIHTTFTLSDRSTQVYPILIGRNVLKNKFIVDVAKGKKLATKEQQRRDQLNKLLDN